MADSGPMTLLHYQTAAEAFSRRTGKAGESPRYVNHLSDAAACRRLAAAAMGLVGETGEVVDLVKKVVGHDHPYSEPEFRNELGDCMWYAAEILSTVGVAVPATAISSIGPLEVYTRHDGGVSPVTLRPGEYNPGVAFLLIALTALSERAVAVFHAVTYHLACRSELHSEIDRHALKDDVLSFVSGLFNLMHHLRIDPVVVVRENIAKLAARYPDGFAPQDSINRDAKGAR